MGKIKLWRHQQDTLDKAENLNYFAIFHEMGAGKTLTCIRILAEKCNREKRLFRILVFCPPIVIENWRKEFLKFSNIGPEQVSCLYGSGKKRLEIFHEKSARPHVFITNYESLLMAPLYEEFKKWNAEAIVFDESHRLKDPSSKRSKYAERLVNHRCKPDPRKWCLEGPRPLVYLLSGSPVLNDPTDIFQQYKVLDGGQTFGHNFYTFRNTYFTNKNDSMKGMNSYFPNWVPKPGSMERIAEKLKPTSMRVLKKDCMDLPPLVRQTVHVDMTPAQEKLYKAMLADYVAFLEKNDRQHATVAELAMTRGLRLMQIASGFIKSTDDKELDIEPGFNPKQVALKELLEQLTPHHKVIVWSTWRKTYDHIRAVCDSIGVRYTEVHGDVPGIQKFNNVDAFNGEKDCRVLIGHPGSGGIGINLVSASYSIFYSRNFSLEQDIQAEARNYRGGSEIHERITRIDLLTRNSIEEKILEALVDKQEISDIVLRNITLNLGKGLK